MCASTFRFWSRMRHPSRCRLDFDCTPVSRFLDLDIDGRRVSFSENVIYEYEEGKIRRVWAIIDKAEIEAQLSHPDL
jgi:predicted ester cyclase